MLIKVETQWQQLVGQVSHVDAPGDSFAHLLNILGLQATSVDYQRRIGTYQTFLWNLAHLMIGGNFGGNDPMVRYFQRDHARAGSRLLNDLGFQFPAPAEALRPALLGTALRRSNGPLIDDVAPAEDEKLSETDRAAGEVRGHRQAKATVKNPRTGTTSAGSSAARSIR